MRSGWWVGGLVLMLLVASFPGFAAAGVGGISVDRPEGADDGAALEKAREDIRAELLKDKPNYEEIETPLAKLLDKARAEDAEKAHPGKALPGEVVSEQELRDKMTAAVNAGKYNLAEYYLERIKMIQDKPNPFGGWLDLTIWTIVVFLLLLVVMGRFAWKPMLQGLQKREADIRSAVDDARTAREEAQRLREEVQAERAKIEETRRETIQKAETDAQRRADEIVGRAKAEMQAEGDRSRRELESARDQALQDLMNYTTNLAALVSSKTIRRNLTPEDHRRFVDEAVADLRQAGNGQKTTASV